MAEHHRLKVLNEPIAVLGAGVAGLINAQVLQRDGFTDIHVITRDMSVGGVWCRDRIYPGLTINNVHGEYRFSSLEMPPPATSVETGGHITGVDMCNYMESFAEKFLNGRVTFHFETEFHNLRRDEAGTWHVKTEHLKSGRAETLEFKRIVLCTGGCSNPKIPLALSPAAAERARFRGMTLHSSQLGTKLDEILSTVKPYSGTDDTTAGAVLVVGGGKSAQDICAKLAIEGRRVINVFETTDTFLASKAAIPDFIRKSRFLGLLSPHIELRTRLERFLHTTWLGSKITHFIWNKLNESSLDVYGIPKDSPLRLQHSLFWSIRVNDEGRVRSTSYHALVNSGKIEVIAPTRASSFSEDGKGIILANGKTVQANVVILATGWQSSWSQIFDEETAKEIGIGRHKSQVKIDETWNYATLAGSPPAHPDSENWVTSIYRGIIPAKNIDQRDFAIGGALFTGNNGYTSEVAAHWISSYFQGDKMRLPSNAEDAIAQAERKSAWIRTRFPDMLAWINESYSATLDFWTWPQAVDELLEDMYLLSVRSGGNWLTWPFQVIDLKEISTLEEERRVRRQQVV
ncbi:hypothetical protein BDQ12DRAFT_604602 [Crucibulum laeve]|uniref:FAD/NAD(P)-binding domain-containing protein n=1 Tax=Crucibulum laeve TaxID=68775 RepID=A0A5C3M3W9_9AGAR|nr:hypothetical protein BDQ12DRAFT_604602 [Crucibulum laeve]